MKIKPQESRILMTEAALNPHKNREKMCEILFEKFEFDKVQIGIQALLSVFAEVDYSNHFDLYIKLGITISITI